MCFAVANKQHFKKHKQNEIIHIITAMLHFSSLKINNFALSHGMWSQEHFQQHRLDKMVLVA